MGTAMTRFTVAPAAASIEAIWLVRNGWAKLTMVIMVLRDVTHRGCRAPAGTTPWPSKL